MAVVELLGKEIKASEAPLETKEEGALVMAVCLYAVLCLVYNQWEKKKRKGPRTVRGVGSGSGGLSLIVIVMCIGFLGSAWQTTLCSVFSSFSPFFLLVSRRDGHMA